ncbi:unnamed protein product (macronuclear) [Paramecium tetraurelia]|uniref:Uncharacterized protein n=1 Tax=Paramecium tetraurelia TaxID=5888 RepID=A0CCY6_PARTE|nr:uncharacterized protein GSPATT00037438001 [Paramecium tetraurelia]CAK68653.1 unnamed protein product [Paramecium tetraurelia]|eukprot:XP_001436050.1 hypothetical protein (macronuclear) [Paramecium tetraurelia strain d4-2]
MILVHMYLLALMPVMVLSTCNIIQQQDHVYPTVKEYYKWEIRNFIQGDNLIYQLDSPTSLFQLEQPLHRISEANHLAPHIEMIAIRAFDIPETGAWTNDFAFMGQDSSDDTWWIYYSEGKQIQMNLAPQFSNELNFLQNNPLMKCLDLEYIDRNTFLVDCIERGDDTNLGKNYIYIVKKGDPPVITSYHWNSRKYKTVNDRKVQYHVYNAQNIGEGGVSDEVPLRILLRGQYAYGTPGSSITNLDGDCMIELLTNNDQNEFVETNQILDRNLLIKDLQIKAEDQENFKFKMIDFKIMPNGDIYVLDAQNGIYIYFVTSRSEFKFKRKIEIGADLAYAFDVNNKIDLEGNNHVHIAVVHQKSVVEYIDGQQTGGWLDAFDAKHPAFIFASQQFLIVNPGGNTFYIYNSDHQYLIHTEVLLTKIYLANPYEPDLIAITNSFAYRYEVGYARLAVHSYDATLGDNEVEFSATATDKKCSASLKYQIIKEGDTTIYPVDHDPFPQVMQYPSDPIFVQELAAGPNLIYNNGDDSQKDHVIVDIHTVWELNVTGLTFPTVTDVAYADVLIDPHWSGAHKFWFLYQLQSTKQIEIFECTTKTQLSRDVHCEEHAKFKIPNILNPSTSQFDWDAEEGDVLTLQFIENDYQISIYESTHDQSGPLFKIDYEQTTDNKITSFTVLRKAIYVVLPNKKEVDAWFGFFPTPTQHIISSKTILMQGSERVFEPKRVFGNPALKSEFVLIQSKDCIFFGDMRNTFTLIYVFDIIPGADVRAYLGTKTIFIVQKSDTLGFKIQEYNYEKLNNIYLMKELPLYDYVIQSPLTTDYCYQTGFLFVRALDPSSQETVILVYESNVLYQLSLHKVVKTHLKINDGQVMNMAAAGHDQMYMYVNNQQNIQKMIGFLRDAIAILQPSHLTNQYVTNLMATVNITNQVVTKPYQISYPIKYVNTQTYIKVDQEELSKQKDSFVFLNQAADQFLEIKTTGWQSGQVIKYDAECNSCGSQQIKMLNPVYNLTTGQQYQQRFIDGVAIGTSMIFLTSDSLILQDETGKYVGTHKLPLGIGADCKSITATDNGKAVLCGCEERGAVNIYLVFCDGKTFTSATPTVQQVGQNAKYPSKLLYKDGILFILDNNNNDPTQYDGSVRVHKVNINEADKSWTFETGKVINSQFLSTEPTVPFQPADFDVIKYEVGNVHYFKLLLSSALYRVWFVDLYFDNGTIKFGQHDKFDLFGLIDKNFAIKSHTRFYQIRAIKSTKKDKSLLTTALISTNIMATYAVTFTYDITDPVKGAPVSSDATVPFLLANYGTWRQMNKLTLFEDHVAIAYTNQQSIMVAVYLLPTIDHNAIQDSQTKVVTLIGGEEDQQMLQISTYFVMTLSKDATLTRPVLHTNLLFNDATFENMLIKYGVTDYPRLFIQKGDQVEAQNVYITARNDYGSAQAVIHLTKKNPPGPDPPGPEPDNDSKGSSNWWWITLIVIFGVAILGVGGYFIYTKFFQNRKTALQVQAY